MKTNEKIVKEAVDRLVNLYLVKDITTGELKKVGLDFFVGNKKHQHEISVFEDKDLLGFETLIDKDEVDWNFIKDNDPIVRIFLSLKMRRIKLEKVLLEDPIVDFDDDTQREYRKCRTCNHVYPSDSSVGCDKCFAKQESDQS